MICCPYCPRKFTQPNDLRNHLADKRLVSAAHGAGSGLVEIERCRAVQEPEVPRYTHQEVRR